MIVVDSSVIFKWFDTSEDLNTQAKVILRQHLSTENEILIPDLLLYEITNAWVTKTRLNETDIKDNLERLEKYSLRILTINFELIKKAAWFSVKYHVSVYDAIYAVIAEDKNCTLITADDKFADRVNLSFVKKLSSYKN